MRSNIRRVYTVLALAAVPTRFVPTTLEARGQTTTAATATELRVGGDVSTPLVLTVADLKKMPRKTISVVNPHDKKKETYEGVLLEDLLNRAGVPQGDKLRGASMACYVVAEAEDGYRVVFSLAELDSGILDSDVIVADTMDGAPLAPKQGPFRLVAPLRSAPHVGLECSITVVRATNAASSVP